MDAWCVELRQVRSLSRSSLRSYQICVRQFCDYLIDGRYGRFGVCNVRWGKASRGGVPRRRSVLAVWPWSSGVLEEYLEVARPRYASPGLAMWPTERGGSVNVDMASRRFAGYRDAIGLPAQLHLHCLRHFPTVGQPAGARLDHSTLLTNGHCGLLDVRGVAMGRRCSWCCSLMLSRSEPEEGHVLNPECPRFTVGGLAQPGVGDVVQVDDRTMLVTGQELDVEGGRPDVANCLLHVSGETLVVVDTGATVAFRDAIRRAADGLGPWTRLLLLTTRGHTDHVGNNDLVDKMAADHGVTVQHFVPAADVPQMLDPVAYWNHRGSRLGASEREPATASRRRGQRRVRLHA